MSTASLENAVPAKASSGHSRLSMAGWCLFDAANSAFAAVIITFVFSVYFARSVVGDEALGSAWWGYAMAASGLMIAVAGPLCGAIADHYGACKPWTLAFSFVCVVATTLLFFITPEASTGMIAAALLLVVIANVGFEMALVFSNAILPHLAPASLMGRLSGWAWAAGYVGGLICLVLALVGFVGLGDMKPLVDLPQENAAHIRAVAPLVAGWFVVLSIPFILFTRDVPRTGLRVGQAARAGLVQLRESVRNVRAHGNLLRFLISSAVYRDGLNTLFAVGGLFAAAAFGMDFTEILIFAIGLNVTAGIGAFGFAFVDDYIGSKRTILISLVALVSLGLVILVVQDKNVFLMLALGLGIFIGPVQAASRTLVARLAPPDMVAQTFGLYAFTGKCVSFLGPALFGVITMLTQSPRMGLCAILLLWTLGGLLLWRVRDEAVTSVKSYA